MKGLKIESKPITLVDQVEDRLLTYIKENRLEVGDSIPNEMELSAALGVARNVVREALSRLKMIGMIESRTRRGMILREPSFLNDFHKKIDPRMLSEKSLLDILGLRVALELGICHDIFNHLTPKIIQELDEIVQLGEVTENNEYSQISEYSFHSKLYEITENQTIMEFQGIIHPVMNFVKTKFKDVLTPINKEIKVKGEMITHKDLLAYIKNNDEEGYHKALEKHFAPYYIFISTYRLKNKL